MGILKLILAAVVTFATVVSVGLLTQSDIKAKIPEIRQTHTDAPQATFYEEVHAEPQKIETAPKVAEKKPETKETKKPTWRDNPNKCNLETQVIWEDTTCHDKPKEHTQSQPTQNAITGTPAQWMTAAGIPKSDWHYVDCVINGCDGVGAEGGWGGTRVWNTQGSGAYGLCQSLPASKMATAGADYMDNPVTQLKWCHSYAQGYGGWKKAWEFRKCIGSCYSARTKSMVYKDHTWW